MRILTVAVLSFALGATLASLYGSQTSKSQPSMQSQQEPNLDMGRAPTVPLGFGASTHDAKVSGGLIVLDGYSCVRCEFEGLTLRYGGGVYQLDHSKFGGKVSLQLSGAAANTVAFLSNLGLGICKLPTPMERPNPNKPILKLQILRNQS